MNGLGMGGHLSADAKSVVWLTPPEIIEALGPFDLDPCAATNRPWPTADKHYTSEDDGLSQEWTGRVWCNPPYGRETGAWLKRMAEHYNGVALVFARTETQDWHKHVWPHATGINFLEGRLHFYREDGTRAKANAGAPSALIAYGMRSLIAIRNIPGRVVYP